jgi:hypothetical protein
MIDPGSPDFPAAKDDDDDDVAWGLSTAAVQWKRGSRADAVVWLRRAIEAAVAVGATWRAAELTRQTDALEAFLIHGSTEAQAAPALAELEDYDGTDMIGDEVASLPPDADVNEPSTPEALSGDATDETTDISHEDPDTDEVVELDDDVEVIAEDEIADDDLDADDLADDDLADDEDDDEAEALPRFASEAPTADLVQPAFSSAPEDVDDAELADDEELEGDAEPDTVSEPEPPYAQDEDPSPTPVRLSVADELPSDSGPDTENEIEVAPDTEQELEPAPDTQIEPEPELDTQTEPEPEPDTQTEPEPELDTQTEPEPELDTQIEPDTQTEPEAAAEQMKAPESEPPGEPRVAGILLSEIAGFEDFPPETQLALARAARVERLATEEEVSGFGLALVLRGAVNVMPAIADVACGAAGERELIYGRGTLEEGVALRLVATAPDTQIAIWDLATIEPPLADCPWVLEELQSVADKYQALAGVSMGPMGERLDDSLRGMVLSRCSLVRLLPGEVLVERGKPVGGLFIVGAGRIELGPDAASAGSEGELGPGDFLFAPQVLAAGAAPTAARAGASGALLMAADRHAAHELMVSVPPLLELLAG